jgi:P pilus assembly chaperone PapD
MRKLIVVASILLSCAIAHAGLSVTPARQEIVVQPGDTCTGVYSVRNEYDTRANISVEFRDWFILGANKHHAISDWLKISPSQFTLLPGESKDVEYAVRLSTDAQGVSVGMISFIPQIENDPGVTLVISVSLFVTAAGTEKTDWQIEDIKIEQASGQMRFAGKIKNNGNVHVRPTGTARIVSGKREVAQLNFDEGRPVYPGTVRSIVSSDVPALKKGKYTAIVSLSGNGQNKDKKITFKIAKSGEIAIK